MNPEHIRNYLTSLGYDACLAPDCSSLFVTTSTGGETLTIAHRFPAELLAAPRFSLVGIDSARQLAHVIVDPDTRVGSICFAESDSLSVNVDVPQLAYAESLRRHIALLQKAITDPDWNRAELVREFYVYWERLCLRAGTEKIPIFVAAGVNGVGQLQMKSPEKGAVFSIRANHFALTQDLTDGPTLEPMRRYAGWKSRPTVGKAMLLRLSEIEPAPALIDDLPLWYSRAISSLDAESQQQFDHLRRVHAKNFWLVFLACVADWSTWLAIHFRSEKKGKLPTTEGEMSGWTIEPHRVKTLSRESLVARGGGGLELRQHSVLLVGCGSVGSELAARLTSAGVEQLVISDPENFVEANLYRHTLSLLDLGMPKTSAIAQELGLRQPWANVEARYTRLEDLRSPDELRNFDLVVVAIGSPTIERVFRNFVLAADVRIPVINCWVEGYGIGGHAILCVPESKGCWHCAYVDPDTLGRGLASNLNFLAPNQDIATVRGGCGDQFLSYSGIAASYTATMTADLAVKFLERAVTTSSKVSWKGSSSVAEKEGLKVTHRFRCFGDSLTILSLHNAECDVCSD